SMVSDMSPILKWTLAVIAGGGAAGLVQGATVLTRGASGVTTAGLANPVVATAELGGSIFTSILSIFVPVLAVILVLLFIFVMWKKVFPRLRSRFFR
ncbi:MAG: DUF4126 domain-containing protein, partial [Verrucomicrobiota bacterium]|nr:DUF4126 domain-containing protein [Verrucomicrobiota bacterium]